jgi:hypothetical protein
MPERKESPKVANGMNTQPEVVPAGRAIYERVTADVGRGMAYTPFLVGIFWLIAHAWPGAGRALFWLAAAFMAYSVIHFAVVILAGIAIATTRNEACAGLSGCIE